MLIAVTGANGFIGKHLCNYFDNQGYNFIKIQRSESINSILINDINSEDCWIDALKNVTVVIHCAAAVHVFNKTKTFEKSMYSTNVKGTRTIAKAAAAVGVKRFIFISSIKVNGEYSISGDSFCNSSIDNALDPYSKSKLDAEKILFKISSQSNMEFVIIRPPLVYGPFVRANFLQLLKLVDYQVPLPFLKVKNKRSIIFIGNLVSFIEKCTTEKCAANRILLVSDEFAYSTRELIDMIADIFHKKARLFYLPILILDLLSFIIGRRQQIRKLIYSLEIDSEESYNLLSWKPIYSTYEGLRLTIEWYKSTKVYK